MTKLAIIPFTVLLETIFLKKQFRFFFHFFTLAIVEHFEIQSFWELSVLHRCSQNIKLSLFLLLVGVGIVSITDLQLNYVGTILSLLAIVTTCVGQIVSFDHHCFLLHIIGLSTYQTFTFRGHIPKEWNFFNLMNVADKHNTEEVKCVFNAAALPVGPISSSNSFCLRPFGRSITHQTKCVCL